MRSFHQSVSIEQAHRAFDAGDLLLAESLANQVLKQRKGDLKAMRLLGMVAFGKGDPDAAIRHFRKCLEIMPSAWVIHHDIAQIDLQMGRFDEALSGFNRALKHKPGYTQALAGKAEVYERKGDREQGLAALAGVLNTQDEDAYVATAAMKLLSGLGRTAEAIDLGGRHADRRQGDPAQARLMFQQLGRLYDKVGDYAKAFDAFTRSNQGGRPFSPAAYVQNVDNLIEAFSAANMREMAKSPIESDLPVFIACMPRSGSTLVDQIVHAHPQAYGSGEMETLMQSITSLRDRVGSLDAYPLCMDQVNAAHLAAMGNEFLAALRKLDRDSLRITNKHLHNYRHLGIISRIYAKARVIHIHRDPLDNCLGMYMAALDVNRYPYVGDFRHLGLVYRQYQRLMSHWKEVLDMPILDVGYEDLVDDPDGWIRRIIDFVGLPWDDKCLRYYEADRAVLTLSYDQVRRPIFKTAVNRARRYAAFLGPLREALDGAA